MADDLAVPFADLARQHAGLQPMLDAAVGSVVNSCSFIDGPAVGEFERAFAEQQQVPHVVGCANGTDAIYVVLKVLGIGPGDEVIVPANTWISTAEVVTQAGADVVFVDVDDFYHLEASTLEDAVTARTRAVIGVHLYGQPFDVDRVVGVCQRHGLSLIEDAAQAHGASWRGTRVGNFGVAATFSFFPSKNIGAWGDAGCIATTDEGFAQLCRRYGHHGALRRHEHEVPGINSRLDTLQAAVLGVKLPHLEEWNRRRQEVAARYTAGLADVAGVVTPLVRPEAEHVWHQYVVRVLANRPQVIEDLKARGIATGIHYPRALHLTGAYAGTAPKGALPVAERNQDQILSLPIYAEIEDAQVDHIIASLRALTG